MFCTADKNGELDPYNSTFYQYDEKGQLVRVDDKGDSTQTYTYDSHGNIKKIKSYAYTKGEIPDNAQCEVDKFNYDEADPWPDKLSNITNGINEIVYDENGNPVSLEDLKVSWTNGRQLESFYELDDDGNKVPFLSFTYDDNGIRTSKTFGDTTTYYTNIDGNVTAQYQLDSDGNIINLAEFIYDSANDVIGFTYEGETYFYLKNLQNDVIGVIDSNGELMAEYYYSTWGWHTGWSNDDADVDIYDVNPFRYRSYIYDEEMSMCYLQSRYYITTFGRFLNSDLPEYAQLQKNDYAGLNLFAYCCNDPVNKVDPSGYLAIAYKITIAAMLGGLIGAMSEAIIQYYFESKSFNALNWRAIAIEFVSGAVNGALIACNLSPQYKTIVKGIATAVTSLAHNINKGNFSTPSKALISIGSALLSTVCTMYVTCVSENIKRITGKRVADQTIKQLTKKVSINRLRRAGIRLGVRVFKVYYEFRID